MNVAEKERVVFGCYCGGHHYLEIWVWGDEDDWSICFVERPKMWRDRIKSAWKALRGEDIFNGELYADDIDKFVATLQSLAKQHKKKGS